jgi:sterol 24-C-methyltransferase
MSQTATQSKMPFWMYRLSTIAKSFKFLYSLPPEKLNAFLNSYRIFDHDWADEAAMIKDMGVDYCNEVKKKSVDYYAVLNHLCAIGQVEKMYIPAAMDLSKSIIENQNLFERKMARDLGLKQGNHALEMGCGKGRVANHMATYTGAQVTGFNIDEGQLESARQFTQRKGMTDQCHFQVGNVNTLPFPFQDESFDAAYEIQVLSYCKNLEETFREIHRVLKPGGRIACLDWVVLDAYDPKNAQHSAMMKEVKAVIGAVGNPTIPQYTAALKKAGFTIIANENASIDGLQAPLIEQADKFYTRLGVLLKALCKCKILPAHFHTLFERLSRGGQDFVKADRMRLVSTSYYLLAEKR